MLLKRSISFIFAFLYGFAGFMLSYLIAGFLPVNFRLIIIICLTLLGIIYGYFSGKSLYYMIIVLIGLLCGIMIYGFFILQTDMPEKISLSYISQFLTLKHIIAGIIGGLLALIFNKYLIIVITNLIGAYLIYLYGQNTWYFIGGFSGGILFQILISSKYLRKKE
jgi:hypothetical protein